MGGLWGYVNEAFWMSLCLPRDGRDAWRSKKYWMVWILLQGVVSSRDWGLGSGLLGTMITSRVLERFSMQTPVGFLPMRVSHLLAVQTGHWHVGGCLNQSP